MTMRSIPLAVNPVDEKAMGDIAPALAGVLAPGMLVFLKGDLGSGKTTLIRCLADSLGVQELVTSPSFALLNVYAGDDFPIAHFDLYRLSESEDLESLGADEFLQGKHLIFVEWPDHDGGFFGPPDLLIEFTFSEDYTSRELVFRLPSDSVLTDKLAELFPELPVD